MIMSKYMDFTEVLRRVQEHISKNYAILITDDGVAESKIKLKSYIKKYIEENQLKVDGYNKSSLIERLYMEMAEFSFLTGYLERDDIEEINVNSFNDIKVTYSNGEIKPADEHFNSPTHAMDVIRRLLHQSGMILDSSQPIVVGHLSDKIRITAIAKGIVDKDVGVSVSIRIINPRKLSKEDFIRNDTASAEMLDFLTLAHRYGESICFTGATSSGKTTLMSYVLSTLPNNKRLFTIENGTREFNLIQKNDKGEVINNVIHTVTRQSDDPKQSITMAKLLETALTVNPDYICVAEMKSDEAFYAQESARSGHGVSTTIHANSCIATYYRMVTLCKQKYDMDEKTLYNLVTEAFPIIAFCKKLEDNTRHIMEITECLIKEDGSREIRTLHKYNVVDNVEVDGRSKIIGQYEMVSKPSAVMQKRLLENGISKAELSQLMGGVANE
ncbi:CpaF family protein [Alkaliphilus pronyensis]|uniref:CpaF family protein n=2 Tax=Alkaliphilus pronyensis TaxID=1482732 RepID=A0A6I0FNJ8_9FIRM|nr:CpaF family protein [Alkaliphilus pronyensis]